MQLWQKTSWRFCPGTLSSAGCSCRQFLGLRYPDSRGGLKRKKCAWSILEQGVVSSTQSENYSRKLAMLAGVPLALEFLDTIRLIPPSPHLLAGLEP